jgi:hypothetical protein
VRWLTSNGSVVLLGGLLWVVLFAGLPYPNPPPEYKLATRSTTARTVSRAMNHPRLPYLLIAPSVVFLLVIFVWPLAVGVPGTVSGLEMALHQHGSLRAAR